MNAQQLSELENVLRQLYETSLDDTSRKNIERSLQQFQYEPRNWVHAEFMLNNSQSKYVQWFALSLYEIAVKKNWWNTVIDQQSRQHIKAVLFDFLVKRLHVVPPFVWSKACSTIVAIAKIEWPAQWPDFLDQVYAASKSGETIIAGLSLFKAISEEFVSTKEDLPNQRKEELRAHLLQKVPGILEFIGQVLDTLHAHYSQQPGVDKKFDVHTRPICLLALETLMQYLNWVPLSNETIHPSLLPTIVKYLMVQYDVSLEALNCLNEILSKSYVPREADSFFVQISQAVLTIMAKVTADESEFEDVDDKFKEKLTLFLTTLVEKHFKRFEANPQFPMNQFLAALFKYTTLQGGTEEFTSCVDIWSSLIEHIEGAREHKLAGSFTAMVGKYSEALIALVSEVLKRSQFLYKADDYLLDLNDVVANSQTGETELDAYLNHCIECVSSIAALYPQQTLRIVSTNFQQLIVQFQQATQSVIANPSVQIVSPANTFGITPSADQVKLFYLCYDIRTYMKIYGRLSELFLEDFSGMFGTVYELIVLFNQMCSFILDQRLYTRGDTIAQLAAQGFLSILAFSNWIRLYSEQSKSLTLQNASGASSSNAPLAPQMTSEAFNSFLSSILDLIVKSFNPQANIPEKISKSGAQLFHGICATSRPHNILSLHSMHAIFDNINNFSAALPLTTQTKIYVGLSKIILSSSSYPTTTDTDNKAILLDFRKQRYAQMTQGLLMPFLNAIRAPGFVEQKTFERPEVVAIVIRTIVILTDIINDASGENKISKEILYENLKPLFPSTILELFKIYLRDSVILDCLLDLFLALFNSMGREIGTEFIESTVRTFLELMSGQHIHQMLQDKVGTKVISKFLGLLSAVVSDPTSKYAAFTPNIISIALDQIYPLIARNIDQYCDVHTSLFQLLHNLIMNNWKYFFSPQSPVALQQFRAILEAYLQSFKQPDLDLFRLNLESLKALNSSRKLYSRETFVESGMLFAFCKVFFDVLLAKSHSILSEEIYLTIYEMASVNFDAFFNNLLVNYLVESKNLTDAQKSSLKSAFGTARDAPSFILNLKKFMNDYIYFDMINKA